MATPRVVELLATLKHRSLGMEERDFKKWCDVDAGRSAMPPGGEFTGSLGSRGLRSKGRLIDTLWVEQYSYRHKLLL